MMAKSFPGNSMPRLSQEKLHKMSRQLQVLKQESLMFQRVMEGMRSTLPLDELLKIALLSIRQGMGLKRAGVFLVDPDGLRIRQAMGINLKGEWEKSGWAMDIRPRRGYNDQSDLVFGYKKYLLSNNVMGRYKEGLADQSIIYNMALVPIHVGQRRPIGNLAVDNMNHYRRITAADISFLKDYATLLGLAIQSIRNHEQAVELSVTDPLTGLKNRRFFEQVLEQELRRCRRYKRCCGLILADIDFFKKVNDTYGHDAGDEVLKQIARLLKDHLRDMDVVARIGGEEFAVLLPETPPNSLSAVISRILTQVRGAKTPLPSSKGKAEEARVTLSLGVSNYKGGPATPQQLFRLADQSLYRAKRTGRDRCGPIRVFQRK